MASVPGRASAEGTKRFADRSVKMGRTVAEHFRPGPGGLHLSSIGLGTYIGAPDRATDEAVEHALRICLSSGRVNVVDTSINYRHQRAERSVGRALAQAVGARVVARDEVFLATKSGYLAPDAESPLDAKHWVEAELLEPGVLQPDDIVDGCHAMSVPYLKDQFGRSLRNLGVESIDLLYLHNAADAQLPVVGRKAFRDRLLEAFELYEELRREGRLGFYGLATWECLRASRSARGHLNLETAVKVAEEAGGPDHGFRFVEFPFNMGMPEAAVAKNQTVGGERQTLFQAVRSLHIACFTSVPLHQGQLAREGPTADGLTAAQTAIQFARSAPGSIGPIVGQKAPEHLSENLEVGSAPPWEPARFLELLD